MCSSSNMDATKSFGYEAMQHMYSLHFNYCSLFHRVQQYQVIMSGLIPKERFLHEHGIVQLGDLVVVVDRFDSMKLVKVESESVYKNRNGEFKMDVRAPFFLLLVPHTRKEANCVCQYSLTHVMFTTGLDRERVWDSNDKYKRKTCHCAAADSRALECDFKA